MNGWASTAEDGARRHSRNVALVFLSAVTVVGGLVAWEAWQRAHAPNLLQPWPQPIAPPVSTDQTYTNNQYIPGLGYYHAPYYAWFPHPFNYHDPLRGYYAGGLWQAAPFLVSMLASRPSYDAVAAAQRLRDEQQRQQQARSGATGGGFFHSYSSFDGSGFSSSSSGDSSSGGGSGSSISRGGFGGSAHGGGGE